jgi:hypothetical protein
MLILSPFRKSNVGELQANLMPQHLSRPVGPAIGGEERISGKNDRFNGRFCRLDKKILPQPVSSIGRPIDDDLSIRDSYRRKRRVSVDSVIQIEWCRGGSARKQTRRTALERSDVVARARSGMT